MPWTFKDTLEECEPTGLWERGGASIGNISFYRRWTAQRRKGGTKWPMNGYRIGTRQELRGLHSREHKSSFCSAYYRESLIYVVRGSHINIAPFLKISQQQHNTHLFLTRSAQLPHPCRVSCSDLFLHGKYTQEKRREEREWNLCEEPLTT